VVGGIAGLGLAWAGNRALLAVAPDSLPRLEEIRVDWLVVAFAFLSHSLRASPSASSRQSARRAKIQRKRSSRPARARAIGRLHPRAPSVGRGRGRAGHGAPQRSRNADAQPDSPATAKAWASTRPMRSPRRCPSTRTRTTTRGQSSSSNSCWSVRDRFAAFKPLAPHAGCPLSTEEALGTSLSKEGLSARNGAVTSAAGRDPGLLRRDGMRLLQGRDFTDADRAGTPLVSIVSPSFREAHLGGRNPLGRAFASPAKTHPGG